MPRAPLSWLSLKDLLHLLTLTAQVFQLALQSLDIQSHGKPVRPGLITHLKLILGNSTAPAVHAKKSNIYSVG